MELTKAQQAFLQQRAQQQLVKWCDQVMLAGNTKNLVELDPKDPYVRYAADRKSPWIRDKGAVSLHNNLFFILGSGWSAASSFLKR